MTGGAGGAGGDERVDALYGLPLGEFTPARNALAKQLRKEGDREGAEEVKALKKPSIEAWTVNQLVREHGGEVNRLAELGEAQAELLVSGDRDRVRKAMDDVKGTLSSLADHAEHLVRSADRKPTPALLDRVTRMLQNAAATDEGRAALRRGRFSAEFTPDVDGDELPELALNGAPAGRPEGPDDRAERARLERALRRAEEHARLLRDRADDLDRRAAEARDKAEEANREVDVARQAIVARGGD